MDSICIVCGNTFPSRPKDIRKGYGKTCSRSCRGRRQFKPLVERFWAKVEKTESCWLWRGAVNSAGYGKLYLGIVDGRYVVDTTHRISYRINIGPIPDGLGVFHKCDIPLCCNPEHLFLGVHADNMKDARIKGRFPTGENHWTNKFPERRLRGEQQSLAKLTADLVREIRRKKRESTISYKKMAEQYGVCPQLLHQVVKRKIWNWVED